MLGGPVIVIDSTGDADNGCNVSFLHGGDVVLVCTDRSFIKWKIAHAERLAIVGQVGDDTDCM